MTSGGDAWPPGPSCRPRVRRWGADTRKGPPSRPRVAHGAPGCARLMSEPAMGSAGGQRGKHLGDPLVGSGGRPDLSVSGNRRQRAAGLNSYAFFPYEGAAWGAPETEEYENRLTEIKNRRAKAWQRVGFCAPVLSLRGAGVFRVDALKSACLGAANEKGRPCAEQPRH